MIPFLLFVQKIIITYNACYVKRVVNITYNYKTMMLFHNHCNDNNVGHVNYHDYNVIISTFSTFAIIL